MLHFCVNGVKSVLMFSRCLSSQLTQFWQHWETQWLNNPCALKEGTNWTLFHSAPLSPYLTEWASGKTCVCSLSFIPHHCLSCLESTWAVPPILSSSVGFGGAVWEGGWRGWKEGNLYSDSVQQNQLHQLKSEHKGIVLAGLFLASSGSY